MDDIPMFPIVYAHRLVEQMNEENLNSDALLREAGISPKLLTRPDSLLTPRQAHALFRQYMGLSSQSLPALRFGQRLDLITHGLLGHVYLWQGEFRALMETIAAYLRVRFPMIEIELGEGRDYFGMRLGSRLPGNAGNYVIQTFIGSLHTLASPVVRNIVVHCRHDLFPEPGAARAILKCEINSDSDGNEVRFYASAVALQGDSPAAATPSEVPRHDAFEDTGFMVQLRNHLLSHQHGRDCAENIASAMGMSVRTLRRRLADCELNFNKVRTDVRMSVALRYLTTTSISIERIAGYVGYSDQASFTRAFREWKGETPNAIRQQRMSSLQGQGDAEDAPRATLPRPAPEA